VRVARAAFRNYGTAIVEMLWEGHASPAALRAVLTLRNREVFDQALARGKGMVFLSAHFASWELLLSSLVLQLGVAPLAVVQMQRNRRVDAVVNSNRLRFGSVTVPMHTAPREVLRALAAGKMVLMLGDQSASRESLFVDFFGRPAATHRGPALFALKTGAPLVMGLLLRQSDGRYAAEFEEIPHDDLKEASDENVTELTRRHTATLERYIRHYPDHWLWMHKRWKHAPPPEHAATA
jgi:KDO2-lipid IV(A) lauroyltransferase